MLIALMLIGWPAGPPPKKTRFFSDGLSTGELTSLRAIPRWAYDNKKSAYSRTAEVVHKGFAYILNLGAVTVYYVLYFVGMNWGLNGAPWPPYWAPLGPHWGHSSSQQSIVHRGCPYINYKGEPFMNRFI